MATGRVLCLTMSPVSFRFDLNTNLFKSIGRWPQDRLISSETLISSTHLVLHRGAPCLILVCLRKRRWLAGRCRRGAARRAHELQGQVSAPPHLFENGVDSAVAHQCVLVACARAVLIIGQWRDEDRGGRWPPQPLVAARGRHWRRRTHRGKRW
jgi:hypothetical protein